MLGASNGFISIRLDRGEDRKFRRADLVVISSSGGKPQESSGAPATMEDVEAAAGVRAAAKASAAASSGVEAPEADAGAMGGQGSGSLAQAAGEAAGEAAGGAEIIMVADEDVEDEAGVEDEDEEDEEADEGEEEEEEGEEE